MHIIRQYKDTDLYGVLSSWENASKIAHPFLKEDFLAQERKSIPELYLPNADTWVVEDADNQVAGFIALIGNEVGAIFLQPEHQGKKMGRLMMDKAQELHGDLEVEVFEKNSIGRNFYAQYGFKLIEEKIHEQTGERVLRLKFTANKSIRRQTKVALMQPLRGSGGVMDQSVKFWDKIAERYSKQPIADEAAYQKKLQVTREYFRPDMEVLELGCGTGATAITHAPYVKYIQATDISSKMIEIAQGKVNTENIENVTFKRSAIEDFSVPDQTLDAVLGLSILHLLGNKEEVIAKVHKMLKPGGIFVTNTACIGDTMWFFKVVAPIGKFFGLMPLIKVFTTSELEASLTEAGFEIDYQWRQPGKNKSVFIVAKK